MGKRINYEIKARGCPGAPVVLYSNQWPGDDLPELIFVAEAEMQPGPTALLKALLGYQRSRGGPVFTLDFDPGDREEVYRVEYDTLIEGEGRVSRIDVVQPEGVRPLTLEFV